MREILFRGKQKYNGEWVFGSLHSEYGETERNGNKKIDYRILGMRGECDYVIPETAGQFTGVTDKNGKRIFEGDVVRYNTFDDFDCQSVVKFGEYEQDGSAGEYNPKSCIGWYCEVDNFTAPDWAEEDPVFFFNSYLEQQNLLEVNDDCEVIGNIHDNPELLGVTDNA